MNILDFTGLVRGVAIACLTAGLLVAPGLAGAQTLEESLRAALDGDLVTVQRVVERGMSPDSSDQEGNSLLMLASRTGRLPVVSYLLGRKAAVNARSRHGDTALLAASLKGHTEVAKVLLAAGAELNPQGWSPLHYAAFEGRVETIKFLLERGADKNAMAPNEFTPLMLAVRNGHEDAARALLYADPDVSYKTPSGGETALMLAVKKGAVPVIELLKRAGATE